MPRSVALLVNPTAGGGRAAKLLPAVEDALRGHGLGLRTERTTSLEHARTLAAGAADAGETVVTLSGDGLVGCVAGVLREHPGSVMGVIPGGRGNDFARVAGIPRDAVEACAVIATGTETPVDVGDVGGRTFIGIASLGFDSDANRIANEAPAWLGPGVYAYGAIRALIGWQHATFTLGIGGATHSVTGWSVVAANSKAYGGGMFVAPGADLHDGLLDIVTSSATGKGHFLRTLPRVFKGEHVHQPEVTVRRAAEVTIAADRPFVVYADGDPIGELPVTVRAIPGAITVLLPR